MQFHLHQLRSGLGWVLGGAFLLGPLALSISEASSKYATREELAPVMGRIELNGQPVHDAIICFDRGGVHNGFCSVWPDGTFRLANASIGDGLYPARYEVHVFPRPGGPDLPRAAQLAETSGMSVNIEPDWNYLELELH